MTKRQALLRPHSVALSDSKKSTRPPSSKRLSEAEAIARLEPLGWTIISGYAGLSEPCLMRHRCGLALGRLTPKRLDLTIRPLFATQGFLHWAINSEPPKSAF